MLQPSGRCSSATAPGANLSRCVWSTSIRGGATSYVSPGSIEKAETLLGIGAITLDGATEPELLIVGGEDPEELAELLRRALVASAAARSRAA